MTPHQRSDSEGTSERTLTRRTYLGAAGLATAAVSGLAGCLGDDGDETGTLATRVTDQPGDIADFQSCVVTMQGLWVTPGESDDTTEATPDATVGSVENDDREYYQFDEPQEADLVQLQDGNTTLVAEQDLPTGTYAFLQLDVTGVAATLEDGSDASVSTPGEAPLQFAESFEIRADETTTFTADFTPVKRGRTDAYVLQPVASGTEVSYE